MKLTVVSENASLAGPFRKRFGLGLVLEIGEKKILIDCGQDDQFLWNMQTLGLDVEEIDSVIITHAHYDHGGGLGAFFENNGSAKVYISEHYNREYYSRHSRDKEYKDVGLDTKTLERYRDRFVLVRSESSVDENVFLFPIEKDPALFSPRMNKTLFVKEGDRYLPDNFDHEIAVLIHDRGQSHLISGCAHSGVTNMIETAQKKSGNGRIHSVIGGFHLMDSRTEQLGESEETVVRLSRALNRYGIETVVTGHCTGSEGYELIKRHFPGRMEQMAVGFRMNL